MTNSDPIPSLPPSETTETSPPFSSGEGEGDPFERLEIPPEPEAGAQEDAPSGATLDGQGFLDRDTWVGVWCAFHGYAGRMAGLDTLVKAEQFPETTEAGRAIYDTCRDTPALHWVIKPGSVWFQRIAAIAAYGAVVGFGVRSELRAKGARPVTPDAAAPASADGEGETWREAELQRAQEQGDQPGA